MPRINRLFTAPERAARFTLIFICALLVSCGGDKLIHAKKTFFRMDTVVDATVVAPGNADLGPLWKKIDERLIDWEERFSQTTARSELAYLNARAGETVRISPPLAAMLSLALAYADTLGGTFDVSILPIKELWGLGEKDTAVHIPSQEEIDSTLMHIGYKKILFDAHNSTVRSTDTLLRVDVGGVAKGFALWEMAQILDSAGYKNYLVVAGGDIVGKGRRSDGQKWRIGIQHPRDRERLLAALSFDSGSVVTSGDYERFHISGTRRIHHIFSPSTGKSCCANQSLTIGAPDPRVADILSTGLFCRTSSEILAFINARPRFNCVIVDSAGTMHVSNGWEGVVAKAD